MKKITKIIKRTISAKSECQDSQSHTTGQRDRTRCTGSGFWPVPATISLNNFKHKGLSNWVLNIAIGWSPLST